ncbi:MAG: hypothetical protein IRZ16_21190 [Myxococcaceae bacterium]|nr:hypothetical protein [Myxococcaceae bacterium]
MPQDQPPVAIFLHDGSYDRVHQAFSIAAAAVATGRRVDVFLFWWALERIVQGRIDEPDFGPGREAAEARFEQRNMPTIRQLLTHARESGLCRIYACTGSIGAVAATPAEVERHVDQLVGWTTILKLTAGVTDRFYL